MPSPEGKGIARRAWESYTAAIHRVAGPAIEPVAGRIAASVATDLIGFWVVWHLEGGYEGLRRIGMSRSSIYRRIAAFRRHYGLHPDEFTLPGVEIDVAKYAKTRTPKSQK